MAARMIALIAIAFSIFVAPSKAALLRAAVKQELQGSPKHLNSSQKIGVALGANSTSKFFSDETSNVAADPPDMFVAVLTTRTTPTAKRNAIRGLWHEVDGGHGRICARFVVCKANDAHQLDLLAEQGTYGDMLFLDCVEGYHKGILTKKVLAAMRAYRQAAFSKEECLNRQFFMKMDDDTFVAGHRFRSGLAAATQNGGAYLYAGVDLPAQPPERNESSPWYEPYTVWPHQNYAPAMYGGPGYILGQSLVAGIIDNQVADANILWNEDRAVGAWVNVMENHHGAKVLWVRIPGTNGFEWDKPVKTGPWQMYPYTLHHHLSKACIQCLTDVDKADNPHALVDSCFMMP